MPSILLKLLVGHLVGDFLLQGDRDAANKASFRVLARHVMVHAVILTLVLLTHSQWVLRDWLVIGGLLTSHAVIDAITVRWLKPGGRRIAIDQIAHLSAIVVAAQLIAPGVLSEAWEWMRLQLRDSRNWWTAGGLAMAVWVGAVVVGLLVKPYAERLKQRGGSAEGLEQAGRTIGKCERALIYLALITGNDAFIGFVVAAKALLRLPEARDERAQGASEYFLVGTLLSVVWAVVAGLATRAILGN